MDSEEYSSDDDESNSSNNAVSPLKKRKLNANSQREWRRDSLEGRSVEDLRKMYLDIIGNEPSRRFHNDKTWLVDKITNGHGQ